MSLLCLRQALLAPRVLSTSVTAIADCRLRWLAASDAVIGSVLARHGLGTGLILAGVFASIAAAVFLRGRARGAAVIRAAIQGVLRWIRGQHFARLVPRMWQCP